MAQKSQPNAQNSELNPNAHPSGARIEKMYRDSKNQRSTGLEEPSVSEEVSKSDRGAYGETLRPSEREDNIISDKEFAARPHLNVDEPAEGGRDELPDFGSRQTPDER